MPVHGSRQNPHNIPGKPGYNPRAERGRRGGGGRPTPGINQPPVAPPRPIPRPEVPARPIPGMEAPGTAPRPPRPPRPGVTGRPRPGRRTGQGRRGGYNFTRNLGNTPDIGY